MRWLVVALLCLPLAGCSEDLPSPGSGTGPVRSTRESITDGDVTSYINGTVTGIGECRLDQVLPVDEFHSRTVVHPAFAGRRFIPARLDPDAFQEGELCMRWLNAAGDYVDQIEYGHEVIPDDASFVLVMGNVNEEATYTIEILPRMSPEEATEDDPGNEDAVDPGDDAVGDTGDDRPGGARDDARGESGDAGAGRAGDDKR